MIKLQFPAWPSSLKTEAEATSFPVILGAQELGLGTPLGREGSPGFSLQGSLGRAGEDRLWLQKMGGKGPTSGSGSSSLILQNLILADPGLPLGVRSPSFPVIRACGFYL